VWAQPEFAWSLPAALSYDGSVRREKFGDYKGHALAKHAERIERWVAEQPDLTLLEIEARLAKAKVTVAASSVFQFLRDLGLTLLATAQLFPLSL
jgi:transposase